MTTTFSCPSCGQPMSIPAHLAGTTLYCTACNAPFVAPGTPGAADDVAACPVCGTDLEPDARFCGRCGAVTGVGPRASDVLKRPGVVTLLAILNGIGGTLLLLIGAFAVVGAGLDGEPFMQVLAIAYLALGTLALACAVGLWRLRPWGRRVQIGLAVIGLLAIPVGTVVAALVLWYFFRPAVRLLFSGRAPEELSPAEVALVARAATSAASLIAVVVVIVGMVFMCGIISAIAIPNLLNAINRSRQKRSVADMRTIAVAIEAYGVDNQHYPLNAVSVADLDEVLVPEYLASLPALDGWREPFEIRTADDGSWYEIASTGRDRVPGDRPGGPTRNMDCDVVYRDGQFIQWPDGIQLD
jgi:type II secretory pathway pseudopilin PulG